MDDNQKYYTLVDVLYRLRIAFKACGLPAPDSLQYADRKAADDVSFSIQHLSAQWSEVHNEPATGFTGLSLAGFVIKAEKSSVRPSMFFGADRSRPGDDVSCEVTVVVKPDGTVKVTGARRLEPNGENDDQ